MSAAYLFGQSNTRRCQKRAVLVKRADNVGSFLMDRGSIIGFFHNSRRIILLVSVSAWNNGISSSPSHTQENNMQKNSI